MHSPLSTKTINYVNLKIKYFSYHLRYSQDVYKRQEINHGPRPNSLDIFNLIYKLTFYSFSKIDEQEN